MKLVFQIACGVAAAPFVLIAAGIALIICFAYPVVGLTVVGAVGFALIWNAFVARR